MGKYISVASASKSWRLGCHATVFATSSPCDPDLKMGSPHARSSKRRPNVPVKAIPMSLWEEGGRKGGWRAEKERKGGRQRKGEGEGSE